MCFEDTFWRGAELTTVLRVGDVFHPVDDFSVFLFLNGDVSHCSCRGCAVPVFFAGSEPNHVARANLFDWSAFALRPAAAGCDDKRLTKRMGMPCRARARFEGDACALHKCGIRRLKERINSNDAGEPFGWPLHGGLRAASSNFHDVSIPHRLIMRCAASG